jgi:N-acetylmuramoyl-L-alanine amidase
MRSQTLFYSPFLPAFIRSNVFGIGLFTATLLWGSAFANAAPEITQGSTIKTPTRTQSTGKFLVVIDPGHGGPDTGAVYREKGTVLTEKTLTLLIARDLARELIIRGQNVVLTRNDDREVLLSDRTAIANKLKADAFISIHLNSSTDKIKSGGVETFILNHATDDTSKRLADLENAVLKESSANANANAGSNVSLIMKDLILDGTLEPSKELACSVQMHIKNASRDRGVKQALFYVLLGADMPSILIETGFMNNKEDRERILAAKSRLVLAAEIAGAIDDYRHKKTSKNCSVQSEKLYQRKAEPPRKRI